MDLKANGVFKVCNNISNYLSYEKYRKTDPQMWGYIIKEYFGGKEYNDESLMEDVDKLRKFRARKVDIFQSSFLGISPGESICAIAVPLATKIRFTVEKLESNGIIMN